MWISVPDNVDLSVIVWNLRGNTQLWTKQLAQQACNVAKLSTVQNVALAKKKKRRKKKKTAEERQETVKRQTETKSTAVPSKFIIHWALNAHLPLPPERAALQ